MLIYEGNKGCEFDEKERVLRLCVNPRDFAFYLTKKGFDIGDREEANYIKFKPCINFRFSEGETLWFVNRIEVFEKK